VFPHAHIAKEITSSPEARSTDGQRASGSAPRPQGRTLTGREREVLTLAGRRKNRASSRNLSGLEQEDCGRAQV